MQLVYPRAFHVCRYAWTSIALAFIFTACGLPGMTQDACNSQADCLSGYTCVAKLCTNDGGQSGGVGGSTGATTGGSSVANNDGSGGNGTGGSPNNTQSGDAGEQAITAPQFVVGCATPLSQSGQFKSGAAATTLAFSTQPTQGMVNTTLCTVEVAFVDASGNVDTSRNDTVQLSLVGNPNAAGASLGGIYSVPAVKGFATFDNIHINVAAAGYELHASAGALNANSAAFTVQVPAWSSVTVPAGNLGADANGALYDSTSTGLYTSRDGGASWAALDANAPQGPVFVDPTNANSVYITNSAAMNHSADGGVTFTTVCGVTSACTPSGAPKVQAVDAAANVIYGVAAGGVWSSSDGGATWNSVFSTGGDTPTIALGGNNPGVLFAAYGNKVAVSTDAAHTSWMDPGTITSTQNLTVIAVDPTNPNKAYVGGDGGLYIVVSGSSGPTDTQALKVCTSGITAVATSKSTAVYAVVGDCLSAANHSYPSPSFVTSLDAGSSWRNAAFGLASQPPLDSSDNTCGASVVSDAALPGTLYLSLGACGGVYKTTNGGL